MESFLQIFNDLFYMPIIDVFMLMQADKIATLVKAANVNVESYWPSLFTKLVEKRNIEDLIMNVGSGGGGGAAVALSAPSAGGAAAATPAAAAVEEKKVSSLNAFVYDWCGFDIFFCMVNGAIW